VAAKLLDDVQSFAQGSDATTKRWGRIGDGMSSEAPKSSSLRDVDGARTASRIHALAWSLVGGLLGGALGFDGGVDVVDRKFQQREHGRRMVALRIASDRPRPSRRSPERQGVATRDARDFH